MSKKHKHSHKKPYNVTQSLSLLSVVGCVVACNVGMMTWVKQDISEARSEFKQDISEIRSDFRREIADVRHDLKGFQDEVRGWREEMHKETKDFHARLSVLQDRCKHE